METEDIHRRCRHNTQAAVQRMCPFISVLTLHTADRSQCTVYRLKINPKTVPPPHDGLCRDTQAKDNLAARPQSARRVHSQIHFVSKTTAAVREEFCNAFRNNALGSESAGREWWHASPKSDTCICCKAVVSALTKEQQKLTKRRCLVQTSPKLTNTRAAVQQRTSSLHQAAMSHVKQAGGFLAGPCLGWQHPCRFLDTRYKSHLSHYLCYKNATYWSTRRSVLAVMALSARNNPHLLTKLF